jgi:hypothetical protein
VSYSPPQYPDPNQPPVYPQQPAAHPAPPGYPPAGIPSQQPAYPPADLAAMPTQPVSGGYPPMGALPPTAPGMAPPMPPGDIYLGTLPSSAPQPKRRSGMLFAVIGVAAVLVLGGGAWAAVSLLDNGGSAAAARLPGSVRAFAAVNLDVSTDQQLKLSEVAAKFPDMEETGSPQELVNSVLDDIETEGDIKGSLTDWVGLSVSMALWTDSDDRPFGLLSVASRDDADAKDGLDQIRDKAGDDQLGYVVDDGFATIAMGDDGAQHAAKAAAAEAEKSPLSDADNFADAKSWFDDDQVITGWADLESTWKVYEEYLSHMGTDMPPSMSDLIDKQQDLLKGQVAVGAMATDYGIELKSRTFGAEQVPAGSADLLDRLGQLPPSDVAVVAALPDDFDQTYGDTAKLFLNGEAESSQVLDALSGATASLTVSGIGDNAPAGQLSVKTGSPEHAATLAELGAHAPDFSVTTDDSTVTAASPGYAAPDGKLADEELFSVATQDSLSEVNLAAYLDLSTMVPESEKDELGALHAIGIVQGTEDGQSAGVYRLMLD